MKSLAGNSSDAPRTRREQSKPFKQSAAGRDGMLFWDNGTVAVVMQRSKNQCSSFVSDRQWEAAEW